MPNKLDLNVEVWAHHLIDGILVEFDFFSSQQTVFMSLPFLLLLLGLLSFSSIFGCMTGKGPCILTSSCMLTSALLHAVLV
jgi:hypothetical protein